MRNLAVLGSQASYSIKSIEKLRRRHFINSFDSQNLWGKLYPIKKNNVRIFIFIKVKLEILV